jgi:hypothetical protein
MLQRGIDKILNFSKGDNLIEFAADFLPAHAQDCAVQVGILAAGQLRMKTRAHFEETAHSAIDFSAPNRGLCDPGENFQQSGFSSSISANETDHFAFTQF